MAKDFKSNLAGRLRRIANKLAPIEPKIEPISRYTGVETLSFRAVEDASIGNYQLCERRLEAYRKEVLNNALKYVYGNCSVHANHVVYDVRLTVLKE